MTVKDSKSVIIELLESMLDVRRALSREDPLEALGLDSLKLSEFVVRLEEALGREIPDEVLDQIGNASTIGDIEDALTA